MVAASLVRRVFHQVEVADSPLASIIASFRDPVHLTTFIAVKYIPLLADLKIGPVV